MCATRARWRGHARRGPLPTQSAATGMRGQIDLLFVRLLQPSVPDDVSVRDDDIMLRVSDESVLSINGCRVANQILDLVRNQKNFPMALRAIKYWSKRMNGARARCFGGGVWRLTCTPRRTGHLVEYVRLPRWRVVGAARGTHLSVLSERGAVDADCEIFPRLHRVALGSTLSGTSEAHRAPAESCPPRA